MITVEELEARGYRRYSNALLAGRPGYVGLWQRRIEDERGVRFFVGVDVWADVGHGMGFAPKAQMTTRGGTVFNCEILVKDETIEQVEAFFDGMWRAMDVRHYDVTEEAADAA